MNCSSCQNEIVPGTFFCTWCDIFLPKNQLGKRAGIFRRLTASIIGLLIQIIVFWCLIIIAFGDISGIFGDMVILLPIIYVVWLITLLWEGLTPGKRLLELQVLEQQTGKIPTFPKMLLRELIGKPISSLFFGIGFFWAFFDKNSQAWHDKIAGTIVIKVNKII